MCCTIVRGAACVAVQPHPRKVRSVHMLAFETMSKKLINDPERVVDESLAGLVSINSGLKLLEGHRVVLRADVQELVKQGKVKKTVNFSVYANYFMIVITLPPHTS